MGRKKSGNWIFIITLTLVVYIVGSLIIPELENANTNINSIVVDDTANIVNTESSANNLDIEENMVLVGGSPIGIYLDTDGVMVIDTETIICSDGTSKNPAEGILQTDDYIFEIDGTAIGSKAQLVEIVARLDGSEVTIGVRRDNEEFYVQLTPVLDHTGSYKLGIWVRDNLQGLGTLTYIDADGNFGALGHGIHDTDTGELLEINKGELYTASINSIIKGTSGSPGGLEGVIIYSPTNYLGGIYVNSDAGIYGTITNIERMDLDVEQVVATATTEEIEVGPAVIYCTVDDTVEAYDILITEVNLDEEAVNKGLVIEVIDSELIALTGGIVQGMSGAPILQNGKLVGAVTHVFVNDPTKGYGIFIENMIETAVRVE
ncbi:MAG: SpoIVB peptidase [Eubacteriales bacterium]